MNDEHQHGKLRLIADQCVAVRVRVLNRVISRVYDKALRRHGIKVSQMNILVAVGLSEPAQPADICRTLRLDPSTLSRNVTRMKKKGWMMAESGADGRSARLRLTEEGRGALEEALPAWKEAQSRVSELLGPEVVNEICRAGSRFLQRGREEG